ncbi:MAG: DNA-binding protein [Fluviicola sp.]|nr:MAG: DNA-binding protein [Fluviicola sp.]
MIKHFEIAACELDLQELVSCLNRIEQRLVKLEEQSSKESSSTKSLEELLSRKEVANYFKVNISTVRNWTKQGILKKYGVGDRVYYKRTEIEEVLTEIKESE